MKRKKLYYIPGLISILCLPVLLFFFGPEDAKEFNVIKLNLCSKAKDTPGVQKFTEDFVRKYLENKRLVTINLYEYLWDEKSFSYKSKFSFADSELERLQTEHDTTTALNIKLSSQSMYRDFVWLNNEALIHDYKRYAFVDNDFYFFPNPPPVKIVDSEIAPLYIERNDIPAWKPPTKWEEFKTGLEYKWINLQYRFDYLFYHNQQNKLLAAGFLFLIALPFVIRIRQYAKRSGLFYFTT